MWMIVFGQIQFFFKATIRYCCISYLATPAQPYGDCQLFQHPIIRTTQLSDKCPLVQQHVFLTRKPHCFDHTLVSFTHGHLISLIHPSIHHQYLICGRVAEAAVSEVSAAASLQWRSIEFRLWCWGGGKNLLTTLQDTTATKQFILCASW